MTFGIAEFAATGLFLLLTIEEVTVVAVIAALAEAAGWGKVGVFIGSFIDPILPKVRECEIISGYERLRLGPGHAPAARADPDSGVLPHTGDYVKEGSMTVLIENRPMSRNKDRTSCGGAICEGIPSIFVGGEPSEQGITFVEKDSPELKALNTTFAVLSTAKAVTGLVSAGFEATPVQFVSVLNKTGSLLGASPGPIGEMAQAVLEGKPGPLVAASLELLGQEDLSKVVEIGDTLYGLGNSDEPLTALAGAQAATTIISDLQALDHEDDSP